MEQKVNIKIDDDIDLSAIDPALREKVRQRLCAIAAFERAPGRKQAERLAAELGLRPAAFYNLVKAWQTLRDPLSLSGRSRPRTKSIDLDGATQSALNTIIHENPGASLCDLMAIAMRNSAGSDLPMPGRGKIRRYLSRYAPRTLPHEIIARGDLVVEYTVIELPVLAAPGSPPLRPLATVVLDTRTNNICALGLAHGVPTAATTAATLQPVAASFAPRQLLPKMRIGLPHVQDPAFSLLVERLEQEGFDVACNDVGAYEHGKGIEALYSQLSEGLRFLPRLVSASPDRRIAKLTRGKSAMSLTEAEALVRARLGIPPSAETVSGSEDFEKCEGFQSDSPHRHPR